MASFVAPWDAEQVQQPPLAIITNAIESIFRDGKPSEIDYVLNQQRYKRLNPQFVALAEYSSLPPAQQTKLLSELNLESAVKLALSDFKTVTVVVSDYRIVASSKLQGLAGHLQTVASVPVMNLNQLSLTSQTPLEIKTLVSAVVLLTQSNNQELLKSLITENPDFYSALRLDSTLAQIGTLDAPVPREKGYAQKSVKTLSASIVARFRETLEAELDGDDFDKVSSMIHWDQLTYESKGVSQ
jgi:hypothetical protein